MVAGEIIVAGNSIMKPSVMRGNSVGHGLDRYDGFWLQWDPTGFHEQLFVGCDTTFAVGSSSSELKSSFF